MIDRLREDGGQRTGLTRELIAETLTGAVLGAAGGLAFGLLFGLLCWGTSHAAQTVLASAWAGASAAAAAGGIASFANAWFGQEPIGWNELVARRRRGREGPARGRPLSAVAQEGDLIIRITGEVMRVPGPATKRAGKGRAGTYHPE